MHELTEDQLNNLRKRFPLLSIARLKHLHKTHKCCDSCQFGADIDAFEYRAYCCCSLYADCLQWNVGLNG